MKNDLDDNARNDPENERLPGGHARGADNGSGPGDWDMPELRKSDFSDVRKHIFSPWRVVVFLIISVAFWWCFFFVF